MEIEIKSAARLHLRDPQPGIYQSVPFKKYARIHAINQTSLKKILVSPLEYRACIEKADTDSPALQFGRIIHLLCLEPRSVRSRVAVWPGERKGLTWEVVQAAHAGKKKDVVVYAGEHRRGKEWTTFRADHPNAVILTRSEWDAATDFVAKHTNKSNPFRKREIVTQTEFDRIKRMAAAVRKHPLADVLCKTPETQQWRELTLVWNEPLPNGDTILCKARLDLIFVDQNLEETIVDLKSTRRKTAKEFAQDCRAYGYDFQADWYSRGWRALTGRKLPYNHQFQFLTVEGDNLDVNRYWLPEDALTAGRVKVQRALDRLTQCQSTNTWPGANNDQAEELPAHPWFYDDAIDTPALDGFSDTTTPLPELEDVHA
jgi:hypothetical protein